jgi:hypothetical protein
VLKDARGLSPHKLHVNVGMDQWILNPTKVISGSDLKSEKW